MAVLLNPAETIRFSPDWEQSRDAAARRVYILKAPTVWGRVAFKRALAARGARRHAALTMLDALERSVRAAYGEALTDPGRATLETIGELRAELVAFRARLVGEGYDMATEEGRADFVATVERQTALNEALIGVSDVVAAADPRYARLLADNEVYSLVAALEGARLFVVGWERGPGPFRRDPDGVPDDVLAAIPSADLAALGVEIDRLLQPTEDESKNSASPSPSGSAPKGSTAARSTTGTTRSRGTRGRSRRSAGTTSESIPST
jgi:hypothetical protein